MHTIIPKIVKEKTTIHNVNATMLLCSCEYVSIKNNKIEIFVGLNYQDLKKPYIFAVFVKPSPCPVRPK